MKRPAALVAILLCLLALGRVAGAAPNKGSVRIVDVERDGELLRFVLVTPGGPQLDADDFRVKINTLRAPGVSAEPVKGTQRASGAVLVVDTSGSMQGRPITAARAAVRLFAGTVEPGTEVALVSFASDETVESGFTADTDRIASLGSTLTAKGETALHDALLTAIDIASERKEEQRNIVLLSDGADTTSEAILGNVQAAALAAKVRVFIVGLRSPDYEPRSIKSLADATNGKLLVTASPDKLTSLFAQIARTLVGRYTLEVVNPDPNATEVEVHVQVVQETGIESGVGEFELGEPAFASDEGGLSLDTLPPSAGLALLFVSLAGLVYIGVETLRSRRNSPGDRVSWYGDAPVVQDRESMIKAALLERATELATQIANRTGYTERLEADLDAAGIKWRAGEVLVSSAGLGAALTVFGLAIGGLSAGVFFGALGLLGPIGYIKFTVSRRRSKFYQQLPEILLLMSGALKAGHSIQQAMAAVGEDAKPPASDEFRRANAEIRLGATLDDALQAMAKRVNFVDFDWTILAIQIQREVGGNLAEILEIISETIRERDRLRREIKTLTAEGRISGIVLGILPIAMAAMLQTTSPEYLRPLYTTTTGWMMIGISGALMAVGVLWMRKIIRIEV